MEKLVVRKCTRHLETGPRANFIAEGGQQNTWSGYVPGLYR